MGRAPLLAIVGLFALPPVPVLAGEATEFAGGGLGKSFGMLQCFAPASVHVLVDAAGMVTVSAQNPCGLLTLGTASFESRYAPKQCGGDPIDVDCRDATTAIYLGRPNPAGVRSLVYSTDLSPSAWQEVLADAVAVP
jgi:hypothetical protein